MAAELANSCEGQFVRASYHDSMWQGLTWGGNCWGWNLLLITSGHLDLITGYWHSCPAMQSHHSHQNIPLPTCKLWAQSLLQILTALQDDKSQKTLIRGLKERIGIYTLTSSKFVNIRPIPYQEHQLLANSFLNTPHWRATHHKGIVGLLQGIMGRERSSME